MENNRLQKYLEELMFEEEEFKNKNNAVSSNRLVFREKGFQAFVKQCVFFIKSLFDFITLILMVTLFRNKMHDRRFVFTAKNFSVSINGQLEDRIIKPLFDDNRIVFVNHSKEFYLQSLNGLRVYNIGGVVWFCSKVFFIGHSLMMKLFFAHRLVNDSFIKFIRGNEIYTLCYYDLNGMSLVFSQYRENFKLVEIQHGSIVNYPPYVKPSPVRIADVFYVKNRPTADYLKTHLCLNYPSEFRLIPYPKCSCEYVPGVHILYASTVEFNGLHPVFNTFLSNQKIQDLHVIVRLHPREREKESLFASQLNKFAIRYEFDRSKNWLEGNCIKNLIVVSPWSSSIEDSYDNGFVTITIDPVGQERFHHLIDGVRCFYSDNLVELFQETDILNIDSSCGL